MPSHAKPVDISDINGPPPLVARKKRGYRVRDLRARLVWRLVWGTRPVAGRARPPSATLAVVVSLSSRPSTLAVASTFSPVSSSSSLTPLRPRFFPHVLFFSLTSLPACHAHTPPARHAHTARTPCTRRCPRNPHHLEPVLMINWPWWVSLSVGSIFSFRLHTSTRFSLFSFCQLWMPLRISLPRGPRRGLQQVPSFPPPLPPPPLLPPAIPAAPTAPAASRVDTGPRRRVCGTSSGPNARKTRSGHTDQSRKNGETGVRG
jgi:hypothetical protein